jgi:hypothetical protein
VQTREAQSHLWVVVDDDVRSRRNFAASLGFGERRRRSAIGRGALPPANRRGRRITGRTSLTRPSRRGRRKRHGGTGARDGRGGARRIEPARVRSRRGRVRAGGTKVAVRVAVGGAVVRLVRLVRVRQGLRRGERVVRRRGKDRVTRVAVGIGFHRGSRRVAAFCRSAVRLRCRRRFGVNGRRVVLLQRCRRSRSFAEVIGRSPRVRARPVPGWVGSPLTHELVHPPRDPARRRECTLPGAARLDRVVVLGRHFNSLGGLCARGGLSPRLDWCACVCMGVCTRAVRRCDSRDERAEVRWVGVWCCCSTGKNQFIMAAAWTEGGS